MKPLAVLSAAAIVIAAPVSATETVTTNHGGFTQVWFRADGFDAKNGDVESVPEIVNQGLASAFMVVEGSLTGNPLAFYGDSVRQDQRDWWLEYRFDMLAEGEWYIWGRAAQNAPAGNSLGSHWVWILGDLDEEIPPAGVVPDFLLELDRIFGDKFSQTIEEDPVSVGPDQWEWVGIRANSRLVGDNEDPRFPVPKSFREGPNVLRVYERESGDPSVQFEIFVISDVDYGDYRPTDGEAIAALGLDAAARDYSIH